MRAACHPGDELRERLAALDDVVFENQGAFELGLLAAPVLAELVEDQRQLELVPAFRAVLGKLELRASRRRRCPTATGDVCATIR